MTRRISHLAWMIPILALTLGLGISLPAAACGGFECWLFFDDGSSAHGTCYIIQQLAAQNPGSMVMHMGETTISPLGQNRALVTVTGYAAVAMDNSCSTALSLVDGIRRVSASVVLNAETGQPLRESHYVPNSTVAAGFTEAASQEGLGELRWQGFFSDILQPVPDGVHLTYVFEVTLKPGTRLEDLAKALRDSGFVGTARAHGDGTLNAGHIHFRALGDTPVKLEFPPLERRSPVGQPSER